MIHLDDSDGLDEQRDKYLVGKYRKGYKVFKGYTMPESFRHMAKEIEDFEVYDDDIWITTYPKCGTTWSQEMIWCIFYDLDYDTINADSETRMPFIEFSSLLNPPDASYGDVDVPEYLVDSVQKAKDAKRPRIIKTHLPFELLPKQIQTFEKNPKIIHVYRNIKDTCVSYYHHHILLEGYTGDFELFWKLFISGKISYAPMIDNVLSYWRHKERPNFLFIRFEEMKTDLRSVIHRACAFFNKSFPEDDIDKLIQFLSFDSMKTNRYLNKQRLVEFCKEIKTCSNEKGEFIREGKAGGYKSLMNNKVEDIFDDYLQKKLDGTGLNMN